MNFPTGETGSIDNPPTTPVITTEETTRSVVYRIEPLLPNARAITVWECTSDFCSRTVTTVVVTEGTGILITKSNDGTKSGERIMEPGATAKLLAGITYCYLADKDKVFKVLEHREPLGLGGEVLSLLQ